MAEVEVKNLKNKVVEKLELAEEVFNYTARETLVWEAERAYQAVQRKGTHATQTSAEVRGGGGSGPAGSGDRAWVDTARVVVRGRLLSAEPAPPAWFVGHGAGQGTAGLQESPGGAEDRWRQRGAHRRG